MTEERKERKELGVRGKGSLKTQKTSQNLKIPKSLPRGSMNSKWLPGKRRPRLGGAPRVTTFLQVAPHPSFLCK